MNNFYKPVAWLVGGLLFASTHMSYAAELNLPGMTGNINSTITSGFSLRASERNCMLQDGYSYNLQSSALGTSIDTDAKILALMGDTEIDTAAELTSVLSGGNKNYLYSDTCSQYLTDDYGNVATKPVEYGNVNSDLGNLNFDRGDVIDATQKLFTAIDGETDAGLRFDLSFTANVNPALDISSPIFKQLTNEAENEYENDFQLLDAYVTTSLDVGDSIVDITIGKQATNWGEATFIPVGFNGLVANSFDLSKLRAPGSSIREAILPTEQITFATDLEGWSMEAYYQFGHDAIKIDPSGTFFGSQVAATGGDDILASGGYLNSQYPVGKCNTSETLLVGAACNDTTWAAGESTASLATPNTHDFGYLNRSAWTTAATSYAAGDTTDIDKWIAGAANATNAPPSSALYTIPIHATTGVAGTTTYFGTAYTLAGINPLSETAAADFAALSASTQATALSNAQASMEASGFYFNNMVITGGLETAGKLNTAADAAAVWADANIDAWEFDQAATVHFRAHSEKHVLPDDDGQFGIKFGKYFDDIGTGVDAQFYYANYHSKLPYIRLVGKGGMLAGDIVGAYTAHVADAQQAAGVAISMYPQGAATATSVNGAMLTLARGTDMGAATGIGALSGTESLGYTVGSAQQQMLYALLNASVDVGEGASESLGCTYSGGYAKLESGCSEYEKEIFSNINNRILMSNGVMYNDPTKQWDTATNAGLYISFTPALAAAVTPLNYAKYQFVYPEDLEIYGASFSTNVGGTMLNGEVSYRPDFPLAYSLGEQAAQLQDVTGVTTALTLAGYDGANLDSSGAKATRIAQMRTAYESIYGAGSYNTAILSNTRSSLPQLANAGSPGVDFYTTPYINKDILSFDIGTTTTFTASDPIVTALGADSAFLLTELAGGFISDMDNMRDGYIARSGFNEGNGEYLCLGMFKDLPADELTALNAKLATYEISTSLSDATASQIDYNMADGTHTALGSSITDGVFGNGSYCEGRMGADDKAFTYRIVGGAAYNNYLNSAWSLNPSFAWSHDFSGYGPASALGITEGSMSMRVGVSFVNGDTSVDLNYIDNMGDDDINLRNDMDFVSASVSHSF